MKNQRSHQTFLIVTLLGLQMVLAFTAVSRTASQTSEDTSPLPEGVIARVNGQEVPEEAFYRFVASVRRRSEEGQASREQLIEETLVELEAEKRRATTPAEEAHYLTVTDEDLEKRLGELRKKTQEETKDRQTLEETLAAKGIDMATFMALLRKGMLEERMIRHDLKLDATAPLPAKDRQVWVNDLKRAYSIVEGAAGEDVFLKINDRAITAADFGRLVVQILDKKERSALVNEFTQILLIEAKGKELGLSVTAEDMEREIERRKEKVKANQKLQGLTYEQILQAQGLTLDDVRADRRVAANVLLAKLSERLIGEEELRAYYDKHRQEIDDRYGEKVRLSLILMRGMAYPNRAESRSLNDAKSELEAMRERILHQGAKFEQMAKLYSEDKGSKDRGGDVGFQPRKSSSVPDPVMEAAFKLKVGEISEPVQGPEGYYLVNVTDRTAAPTFEDLKEAIRLEASRQWLADLIAGAKIQTRF